MNLFSDLGSNNSGYYTLQAVLTHKGRSSSSGHYVAWVKHTNGSWIKFDDSDVVPVTEEDILKLSGGGNYLNLYMIIILIIVDLYKLKSRNLCKFAFKHDILWNTRRLALCIRPPVRTKTFEKSRN